MPAATRKKNVAHSGSLLWVQCLLCLVLLGGALLLRSLDAAGFTTLGQDYLSYLEQGSAVISSDKVFRFAEKTMQEAKSVWLTVSAKFSGEPLAQGGQYELTHSGYLATVTTASYALSDRPCTPVEGTLSCAFGYRIHPITGKEDFHTGVDLAAPEGTPVRAAFYGTVLETGSNDINGNYVTVVHSGRVATTYCHLSRIDVSTGDWLVRGEPLGLVGQTGMATGPHLHFELLIDGLRVDPAPALGL